MTQAELYFFSTIALALFCVIGAFDGLYFHTIKHKLHLYEETKMEHYIHGLRGILFFPIALIFFVFDASGVIYVLGFLFLVLDVVLEIFDLRVEDRARKVFGGTTCGESLSHIFATGFRILALALVMASRPLDGLMTLEWDLELIPYTPMVILGSGFAFFSLVGGLAHFLPVKRTSFHAASGPGEKIE